HTRNERLAHTSTPFALTGSLKFRVRHSGRAVRRVGAGVRGSRRARVGNGAAPGAARHGAGSGLIRERTERVRSEKRITGLPGDLLLRAGEPQSAAIDVRELARD